MSIAIFYDNNAQAHIVLSKESCYIHFCMLLYLPYYFAVVAELADAHGSGPCGSNIVEVRVLSTAYAI